MKNRYTFLIIFFLFVVFPYKQLLSQNGGSSTYEFLRLPNSARIAAMGGDFLAINDNDITLTLANPSLITPQMNNHLGLSFVDYYSDVNYGFANYSRTFSKLGSYTGTIQFINYGKFTSSDVDGTPAGDFTAGEYNFNLGWGRQLDSTFSIGANFKAIYSDLQDYHSFGIAVDVAGTYNNSDRGLTVSLIGRNIGRQLKSYVAGNNEPLPFELQLGMSQRLKHLPFRYSILLNHLEKWDLTYDDPNDDTYTDPLTGKATNKGPFDKFGDKLMRHVVIGGEFIPSRYFSIRFGYNYQRRQEMKVESKLSTVGFSWGFGLRVSKFNFSYSRSAYHLAGSPNFITITTNLADFARKKSL